MKTKSILVLLLLGMFLAGCEVTKPGALLIDEPLVILENITALLAISLVIIEAAWMQKAYKIAWWKALYGVGILFYALHVVVYYGVVNLIRLNYIVVDNQIAFLSNWSSVLRFHEIGLLLTMEYQRFKVLQVLTKEGQ